MCLLPFSRGFTAERKEKKVEKNEVAARLFALDNNRDATHRVIKRTINSLIKRVNLLLKL